MGKTARFGKARKPVANISRQEHRKQIHRRVRAKVAGSAERPRLAVFRTTRHISAQVIDDITGKTLVSASTVEKELRKKLGYGGNVAAAKAVGQALGERAGKAGVKAVVFDRGGFKYHGRVKALADAARESGMEF